MRVLKETESLRTVTENNWVKIEEENSVVAVWDFEQLSFELVTNARTYRYILHNLLSHFSNVLLSLGYLPIIFFIDSLCEGSIRSLYS